MHNEGYYPPWLTDQSCGDEYKQKLIYYYDKFFSEKDKEKKQKLLNQVLVNLTVVTDVVAYRYLMKHHINLFHKLNITIEEYLDYKVNRMYVTLRDKKEKIDDIMAYVYMSFMLSSPRLIYDYAEKIGKCKLIKEVLPYYITLRNKYFFIEKEKTIEHIVFSVDNLELDEDSELLRSNLDKYSLSQYHKEQAKQNIESGFEDILDCIQNTKTKYINSKIFLANLFKNWAEVYEDDYEKIKQQLKIKDYNLFDYIRYKYENKQVKLNYKEYINTLVILNNILKRRNNIL